MAPLFNSVNRCTAITSKLHRQAKLKIPTLLIRTVTAGSQRRTSEFTSGEIVTDLVPKQQKKIETDRLYPSSSTKKHLPCDCSRAERGRGTWVIAA